jgi:hypothetical protein
MRSGKAARLNASEPEDLSTSRWASTRRDRKSRPREWAAGKGDVPDGTFPPRRAERLRRRAVSASLNRLPPLASTGVGSLPFTRAPDAARHALGAYELPFCPSLPRLYGDMIREWLGADPGRCGWAPDRDRQLPAAWDTFVIELERRPPPHRLVKLQVTGPVTLGRALEPTRERAAGSAGALRLATEISTWLAAAASAQVAALAGLGLDALLIIDEPGLAYAGLSDGASSVWDPLRAAAGSWGLHICGPVPWPIVHAAEPDVLSWDLSRYGLSSLARRTLAALIGRGGRVMWGAVDPSAPGDVAAAAGRITAASTAIAGDRPLRDAFAAGLVSPSCGTGGLTVEHEQRAAAVIRAVVQACRGGNAVMPLLCEIGHSGARAPRGRISI